MIKLEHVHASRLNNEGTVEKVEVLIASIVYKTNDRINISRMEIQAFPLYISRVTDNAVFAYGLEHWSTSPYDTFDLEINHDLKEASFFHWDIILPDELKNCGIGSYMVAKLIEWGKEVAPGYKVKDIKLSVVDAQTVEERDLRNAFYEKQGFELDFKNDSNKRGGYARASHVGALTPYYNTSKISVELPWQSLFRERQKYLYLADDLAFASRDLQEFINESTYYRNKYRMLLFGVFIIFGLVVLLSIFYVS